MSTLKDRIKDIILDCIDFDKHGREEFHSIKALRRIMDEIDKEQKVLRPALRWFAGICEGELRKHETEKGWLNGRYTFYLRRAKGNLREIHIGGFEQNSGDDEIIKSCADASNFCMMLAHNIIESARLGEEEEEAVSKCQR